LNTSAAGAGEAEVFNDALIEGDPQDLSVEAA